MKITTYLAGMTVASGLAFFAVPVMAETTEEMCNRVSTEWQTPGDVAVQCSCIGAKGDADAALNGEIWVVTESSSNGDVAYEQASDALKAALDECSIEHN